MIALQYKVIRTGSIESIIITCPICGRVGRLIRDGFNTCGPKFRILHEDESCHVSYFDGEVYERVKEVYEAVRVSNK